MGICRRASIFAAVQWETWRSVCSDRPSVKLRSIGGLARLDGRGSVKGHSCHVGLRIVVEPSIRRRRSVQRHRRGGVWRRVRRGSIGVACGGSAPGRARRGHRDRRGSERVERRAAEALRRSPRRGRGRERFGKSFGAEGAGALGRAHMPRARRAREKSSVVHGVLRRRVREEKQVPQNTHEGSLTRTCRAQPGHASRRALFIVRFQAQGERSWG
jgi:hypothetical protein